MKEFIVYMAICLTSGGRYIGATSRGLDVRKNAHRWDATANRPGCRVLNAAIRKYGFDSFQWKILVTAPSFAEMMKEEVRLIKELKPEYNITSGGEGIPGLVRTPEWKNKIAAALKGRRPPPQCYAAVDHTKLHKSIVCLNDGKFFSGIVVAAEFYGISDHSIGEVLNGRQFKCGKDNLVFVFSDASIDAVRCAEMLADVMRRRFDSASKRKSRPVVCLTTGVEYKNAVSAAASHGIVPSRVMQLCQSGGVTNSGLSFRYADSPAIVKRERTQAERDAQRRGNLAGLARGRLKIQKRVILVESGEIFDSIALAARKYHLNEADLYRYLEQGNPYNGFTFRLISAEGQPIVVQSRHTARRVLCLTDMVVSNSVQAATKRYGVSGATLKKRCDRNDETPIGANRFCYLDEWCPNPE